MTASDSEDSGDDLTPEADASLPGEPGAATGGDPRELFSLVYDQLRRLAASLLGREGPGHTLDATALVHEAYLKLGQQHDARIRDELHFFAIAARAMRRILVDHARSKGAVKRGGDLRRVTLSTQLLGDNVPEIDFIEIDDALRSFEADNERVAQLVELRFFGGLTNAEAARVVGKSTATAERDWRYARAWLYDQLVGTDGSPGGRRVTENGDGAGSDDG